MNNLGQPVSFGVGYYQEEGKSTQIIRKGDVIECTPGVRHWHGTPPNSWFSQLVVYDSGYSGANDGEEPVTDEYYAGLETEEYAGRNITTDNAFMFQRTSQSVTMRNFSGSVYLSDIIGENVVGTPGMHYVVFEPGVINNWHTHEGGQILIATDGIGYHQIEGESVEVLYSGDVAFCPPGVIGMGAEQKRSLPILPSIRIQNQAVWNGLSVYQRKNIMNRLQGNKNQTGNLKR